MSKNSVAKSFFTNDKIMLTLVVINTITIFLGGYGRAPKAFLWIDSVFTVLFLLEALVKISVYGWNNYWKENWNKFDFIITLVAIPSLINLVSDTGVATNVLLSLRSLRIFKSFRLLKFIPNINGLLKGIGLAMRASLIVTIAFAVLLLIISPFYHPHCFVKSLQTCLEIQVYRFSQSSDYLQEMDGVRSQPSLLRIVQNSPAD